MSLPRERLLAALAGGIADRIPLIYHASPAGLHTLGEPLRQLFLAHPADNLVDFSSLPQPPAGARDAEGRYYEQHTDAWGVLWEQRIFGLTGHACGHPFADWTAAASYRFPALPVAGSPAFSELRQQLATLRQTHLAAFGAISLFERLCVLRPMEEVLIGLADQDPGLLAFLDRLEDYWHQSVDLALAVGSESIAIGDDWGSQRGPLVSPACFDRHFAPRYRRLIARAHAGGARVMFHCCGRTGPLFGRLLELGIDALWPQIGAYDEAELFTACRAHHVLLWIHPDRQGLVPHGTPAEIDACIHAYARRLRAQGGGGLFYIEIENDAPLANAAALIEAVDRWR